MANFSDANGRLKQLVRCRAWIYSKCHPAVGSLLPPYFWPGRYAYHSSNSRFQTDSICVVPFRHLYSVSVRLWHRRKLVRSVIGCSDHDIPATRTASPRQQAASRLDPESVPSFVPPPSTPLVELRGMPCRPLLHARRQACVPCTKAASSQSSVPCEPTPEIDVAVIVPDLDFLPPTFMSPCLT